MLDYECKKWTQKGSSAESRSAGACGEESCASAVPPIQGLESCGCWEPGRRPGLWYDAALGREKGTNAALGCEQEDEIMSDEPLPNSEIILYQTEDGSTRVECRFENETVWLTQAQMADLFQRERSVITKHIRNIFEEGELVEEAVCAN